MLVPRSASFTKRTASAETSSNSANLNPAFFFPKRRDSQNMFSKWRSPYMGAPRNHQFLWDVPLETIYCGVPSFMESPKCFQHVPTTSRPFSCLPSHHGTIFTPGIFHAIPKPQRCRELLFPVPGSHGATPGASVPFTWTAQLSMAETHPGCNLQGTVSPVEG